MLNGTDRAQAIYNALAAQGKFGGLTEDEKVSVKAQLVSIYGADINYIVGAAQIIPGTMQNPAGQPVVVAGSPTTQSGATTAPSTLIGIGRLT